MNENANLILTENIHIYFLRFRLSVCLSVTASPAVTIGPSH